MYSNILKKYLDVIKIFEAYFSAHDIITGGIQTKPSLNAIQISFHDWQQQCELSLSQLSRLIAYATDDNHIHLEGVIDAE
jgi:hypothetical protein